MNPYNLLIDLLPKTPLQVGVVTEFSDGIALITVPGGGMCHARGDVAVGDNVFFRDGVIEGPAPDLPVEIILV